MDFEKTNRDVADTHSHTASTRLLGYFSREPGLTAWIAFFGIATNVLIIWVPTLQGRMIDGVLNAGGLVGGASRQIALFLALVAVVQFLRFFKRYLVRKHENRTVRTMQSAIYNNILAADVDTIAAETTGSLMNKIIGDVGIVSEGLRKIITEIFDTGVMLTGYLVIMCTQDLALTLLSCMFIPVGVLISKGLKNTVTRYNAEYRQAKGELNDLIYQNVTHAVLFRLNDLQRQFSDALKARLPGLRKKAVRASFFDSSLGPLYSVISLAGVVFCVVRGSGNVSAGLWTVGQFSSFLVMFTSVATKASMISTYINLWQKTAVSWRRLKRHLTHTERQGGAPVMLNSPVALRFEDVSFSYGPEKAALIRNLSFEAHTGQIIGICGPVASGKTTLLRMLTAQGGYTGRITVNGLDLATLDITQKSGFLACKEHDPQLLSVSIAENIAFDCGYDLTGVLADTCLTEDLSAMPEGLETGAGSRGVTLSGGQKDRIALARTLARGKPVILLDDPFSALDAATEGAIIQSLRTRYRDALILLTTHRFTVFPYVDHIICLDGTGAYSQGSHDHLMESSEVYRRVFTMQRGVSSCTDI